MTADELGDFITHITPVIETEHEFSIKFPTSKIEKLRDVGEPPTTLAAKHRTSDAAKGT